VAAKVLFFGPDPRRRIPALRRAGYCVEEFAAVTQMHQSVVENGDAAAVAVSGVWKPYMRNAILSTRDRNRIPFILFADQGKHPTPSIFDLVIPANQQTAQWLSELDLLIRECQMTRDQARKVVANSDLIGKQTEIVIEQSQRARERSRLERESSQSVRELSRLERERSFRAMFTSIDNMTGRWDLQEIPGVADYVKTPPVSAVPCAERDKLNWSIMIALATLTNLLWKIMKVRLANGIAEEIDALVAEEKSQAENLETLLVQWKFHRTSHGC
jgi:hypothetical protein